MAKGEIVTGISLPLARHAGAYAKLKRYRGEDLAQASVAVRVDARASGGWPMDPWPRLRSGGPKVERLLKGDKNPSAALVAKAAALAETEVAPITDIRGSLEYRRLMVGVMLARTIRLAARRLAGRGAAYGINILEEDAS